MSATIVDVEAQEITHEHHPKLPVFGEELQEYAAESANLARTYGKAESKDALTQDLNSAAFAQAFMGHYCRNSFSRMHLSSLKRYDEQPHGDVFHRRGTRYALAAPRGAAKSTIHTLIIPLIDILLGREKYIVIISATQKQARQRLAALQNELLNNAKLRELFPKETEKGKPWSKGSFVANGVRVDALGASQEMRGISFGAARPSKIILDDVESNRAAFRGSRRDELLQWYDEVVENLGDTYTHIEAVGTVLHRESLLSRLMGRVGYNSAMYQSVETFSPRQDLWKDWMRLYTDLRSDAREEEARRFYDEHERELLDGTQVLWPQKENYLCLMEQMLTRGRPAFFKEKQNQPLVGDGHIFDPSFWNFFEVGMTDHCLHAVPNPHAREFKAPEFDLGQDAPTTNGTDAANGADGIALPDLSKVEGVIRPDLHVQKNLQVFAFIDPAAGKSSKKGDYTAIATVGRDGDGYFYVLDMWMRRANITEVVDQLYALNEQYNYTKIGYEANGFQEVLLEQTALQKKRRAPQGRPWNLPMFGYTSTIQKKLRISAMEPLITAGWLYFCTSMPQEFITQAAEFPDCRHDDGLDALASCLRMMKEFEPRKRVIKTFKPKEPRLPDRR